MIALAIETAGLWCVLAILSPKQAAHDADDSNSQGDLHQRLSYNSNRVVTPLDQNFDGPNADIKKTAPAWGAEAAY